MGMTTRTSRNFWAWRKGNRGFSSNTGGKKKRWVALWGNGDFGRLGLSDTNSRWKPTICRSLEQHQPVEVACGGAHTLMLTDEGRVFAAGLNKHGQLGLTSKIPFTLDPVEVEGLPPCVHVAAGHHHSAAVSAAGETYVWGRNSRSQLGLGERKTFLGLGPSAVYRKPQRLESLAGLRLKMLSLGCDHSLAVSENGQVLSWGAGANGCLGHGQVSDFTSYFISAGREHVPRMINSLEDVKIQNVAAGLVHSACVDEHGTVFVFGQGNFKQKRTEITTPYPLDGVSAVLQVACGGYHTAVITRNGDLYTLGFNENGCLGIGQLGAAHKPVKVEGKLATEFISQVSCGWKHTASVTDRGRMYAWGWGGSYGSHFGPATSTAGQLGVGDDFDHWEPMLVSLNYDRLSVTRISCGINHSAAILEESDGQ